MGWREKMAAEQQEKINAMSAKQILKDGDAIQEVEVLAGRGLIVYGVKRDILVNVLPGGGTLVSIKQGWTNEGKKCEGSMDFFAPFCIRNILPPFWWATREGAEPEDKKEGKIIV